MYREQYGEYAYWCWGVKGSFEPFCSSIGFQAHWDPVEPKFELRFHFSIFKNFICFLLSRKTKQTPCVLSVMAESEDSKGRRGIEAHGSLEPIGLHFFADKTKMFLYFSQVSVCNAVCVFFSVFFLICVQAENIRRQRGYTTVGDLEGCVHYKVGKTDSNLHHKNFSRMFFRFRLHETYPLDTSSSAFRPSTFRPGWR